MEKATFGMGCFWSPQKIFDSIDGVVSTTVGYMGGETEKPTYEDVCTDKTGHAEVILIEFDPEKISYEEILDIFWNSHDPTTLNRQGPDTGTQYRSIIFYYNDEQKELALKSKDTISSKIQQEVVTKISPASEFYPAEDYHQKYYKKNNTC